EGLASPRGSTDTPSSSLGMKRPGSLSDGPNARSKSVTVADGDETFGALNCHPAVASPSKTSSRKGSPTASSPTVKPSFRVGVSEDRNKRCRRTMEDAHSFVYDYAGIKGQGYFAVFDGHAGKHAAEWCGQNFHEYLLDCLLAYPDQSIPDLLNKTFNVVDTRLSQLSQAGYTQSGCTAVTAFLRIEQISDHEPKGFTNPGFVPRGLLSSAASQEELELQTSAASSRRTSASASPSSPDLGRKSSGKRLRDFVKGLTSGSSDKKDEDEPEEVHAAPVPGTPPQVEAIEPKSDLQTRKVLYTANVGDARAVLCRGGKAVRLTYDHKGSDTQEAKRITDAGGFVMNNRVNGVLAVTRSLGDASMKEFVVGAPYTTETTLDDQDEFLIVACDGLWDVCEDQDAVDIIRSVQDPQEASRRLLDHAITNLSTDNLSVMVIRFYPA
ncbi:phosphatase 2C-domain-containing protein, partial [Kockovaella imperatae]